MRIAHNIPALFASRLLGNTQYELQRSLEKLASGFRINRASDDAAGLAISEQMRTQVNGLKVALRNTQDGISLIQTAEAGMQETHSLLQRIRDLTVQASNDTYTSSDRAKIQVEVTQLVSEISRLSLATTFNTLPLLDGDFASGTGSLVLQVGSNPGDIISLNIATLSSAALNIESLSISTRQAAGSALTLIDNAIGTVSAQRAHLGAYQNRLEHSVNAVGIAMENMQAAESRIRDVDMASELANFVRLQILMEAGTSMLAQANLLPQSVLPLIGG